MVRALIIISILLAGVAAAQNTTDKPTGVFFILPNGDYASTFTQPLPNRVPALKKDAVYKIFKTTETGITTYTLMRGRVNADGTFTTFTLSLPLVRVTTDTGNFTWALKSDYFIYNGNFFHRIGP